MAKKKTSRQRPAPAASGGRAGTGPRGLLERDSAIAVQNRNRRVFAVVAAVVLLGLVGAIVGYGWWRSDRAVPSPASTSRIGAASPATPQVVFAPVQIQPGQGIRIGSAEARNVIAVYLDFHCSHCLDFERQYGPTLTALADSGRASIEYWPLGFLSEGSKSASNAFACAAERDPRFARDLHDALFVNQQARWTDEQLLGLSRHLRPALPDGYESCVTTKPHLAWVSGIYQVAAQGPARQGTPTVTVNGQPFSLQHATPTSLKEQLV